MSSKLTEQDKIVLEEMNRGMYLISSKDSNGLGWQYTVTSLVRAGTIKKLLDEGLIYKSETVFYNKIVRYLLTDAGRRYRKI